MSMMNSTKILIIGRFCNLFGHKIGKLSTGCDKRFAALDLVRISDRFVVTENENVRF